MSLHDRSNNPTAVSATLGRALGPRRTATTELLTDLIMPALLVAFATYLVVGIVVMEVPEGTVFPGPGFFPGLIAAGLYLFAVLLAVAAVRRSRVAASGPAEPALTGGVPADDEQADDAPARGRLSWSSLAWVVLGFLGFALVLGVLGWILAAAALFWCVARGFGEKRHVTSAVVGLTASSVAYIAFDMMLGLSLPSGVLGWGF